MLFSVPVLWYSCTLTPIVHTQTHMVCVRNVEYFFYLKVTDPITQTLTCQAELWYEKRAEIVISVLAYLGEFILIRISESCAFFAYFFDLNYYLQGINVQTEFDVSYINNFFLWVNNSNRSRCETNWRQLKCRYLSTIGFAIENKYSC